MEFRLFNHVERAKDEVEIQTSGEEDDEHHLRDEVGRCPFHDLFAEVLSRSVEPLQGNDEHHQGQRPPLATRGRVGVEHLVQCWHQPRHERHDGEIHGTVGANSHLHGHHGQHEHADAEFVAHHVFRPSNPGSDAAQEDDHRSVRRHAVAERLLPFVPVEQLEMERADAHNRQCLGVNAGCIGGPVAVGVRGWVAKQRHLQRSGGEGHRIPCTPHGGNGREKEGDAEEVVVQVVELTAVFSALGLDHTYGGGKGRQTGEEDHEHVGVGGVFIVSNHEHTAPNGEEPKRHHDGLRDLHHVQLGLRDRCSGTSHGDRACFGGRAVHQRSGRGVDGIGRHGLLQESGSSWRRHVARCSFARRCYNYSAGYTSKRGSRGPICSHHQCIQNLAPTGATRVKPCR